MADRLPGLSNDQGKDLTMTRAAPSPSSAETAPLLQDPEHEEAGNEGRNLSFTDHVGAIAQEPLTPLTKVLLVLALILLLLSSVSGMEALQTPK
jgi:endothelin-converting enzyme